MKRVTFEEYKEVVGRLPHEWGNPIEGHTLCAMQWVAPDDDLVAQAVYRSGMNAQYYVTEKVAP